MLAQRSTGREGDGTDPWQCICAMTVTFFRAHMLPVLTPVPHKPNFLTIRIRNTLCLRRPHCCVSSIKNNAIECRVCKKPYLEREKKSTTITKIHSALKKKDALPWTKNPFFDISKKWTALCVTHTTGQLTLWAALFGYSILSERSSHNRCLTPPTNWDAKCVVSFNLVTFRINIIAIFF